jgi:predicted nucleic acid-binding protein
VEWWPSALEDTLVAASRYKAIEIGLADASLIALAAHLRTTTIATLDERHFRAVKPLTGKVDAFALLPADSGWE